MVSTMHQSKVLVVIKDLSQLLQQHLKYIDTMYQDAIEANFSHEYMTPLNSIINNSILCKNTLTKIFNNIPYKMNSRDIIDHQ